MRTSGTRSFFRRILPDLLAFGIGLSVAWVLHWKTRDLVWSLWLGSLVLGYLTILSILAGGLILGVRAIQGLDRRYRKKAIAGGILVGGFFLAFFSIHFCGFHAGHSVFLAGFFPLDGVPSDGFGRAFMNPILLWRMVFRHLMIPYGIFLVPAIIAERKHVFEPLIQALETVRENPEAGPVFLTELREGTTDRRPGAKKRRNPLEQMMSRPYLNVVRMHLLIFFFAFAAALDIDSFLVYAVVYSVYFFPWHECREWIREKRAAGGSGRG